MYYMNIVDADEQQHRFAMRPINESAPREPGVLLVAAKPTTVDPGILYICCADDLASILTEEAKATLIAEHDADTIGVLIEKSADHCTATANKLIEKHNPPCNQQLEP